MREVEASRKPWRIESVNARRSDDRADIVEAEYLHDDRAAWRCGGANAPDHMEVRHCYDESQAVEVLAVEPGWLYGEQFSTKKAPGFEDDDCYFQDFGLEPFKQNGPGRKLGMQERWTWFWSAAGAEGDPAFWWRELSTRYAEPHRAYHTMAHIEHCLEEFGAVRNPAGDPIAVEMALWFHDAVYDPRAGDNEERSALLALQASADMKLPAPLGARVAALIRASTHRKAAGGPDGELFTDIDLSILGQTPDKFAEYERQVRQEYAWVDDSAFRAGRAEILEMFLERPLIYGTRWFREKYEKAARQNLSGSLARMKDMEAP